MDDHISSERLQEVADEQQLTFTIAEYQHLLFCADCYRSWKDLTRSLPETPAN